MVVEAAVFFYILRRFEAIAKRKIKVRGYIREPKQKKVKVKGYTRTITV